MISEKYIIFGIIFGILSYVVTNPATYKRINGILSRIGYTRISQLGFIFIILMIVTFATFVTESNDTITFKMYNNITGKSILIENVPSIISNGKLIDGKPTVYQSYELKTGLYGLDSGSHLLTDIVLVDDKKVVEIFKKNKLKGKTVSYGYGEGGKQVYKTDSDIKIDNKLLKNVPTNMITLNYLYTHTCKTPIEYTKYGSCDLFSLEKESLNGLMGLSYVLPNTPLHEFSLISTLLERHNKTLYLNMKQDKLTLGLKNLPFVPTFEGNISVQKEGEHAGLTSWKVKAQYKDKIHEVFIDTGSNKSIFEKDGEFVLTNVPKESSGKMYITSTKVNKKVEMHMPYMLAMNDLKDSEIYADYNTMKVYLKQDLSKYNI